MEIPLFSIFQKIIIVRTKYEVRRTDKGVQGTEYRVSSTEYEVQSTKYKIPIIFVDFAFFASLFALCASLLLYKSEDSFSSQRP